MATLSEVLALLQAEIDSYMDTTTGEKFALITDLTRKDKPNYPYIAYNDISRGHDSVLDEYQTQTEIDDDTVQINSHFLDTATISFQIIHSNEAECRNYSEILENWFRSSGYEFLSENNLTATIEAPTTNRGIVLQGVSREYRYGFDVLIRYINIATKQNKYIKEIIPTITEESDEE